MRLTLGKKLGMGFGVILALMVFSTFMAYIKSADIRQSEDITFEVRIPQAKVARELEGDLNQTQSKARHVILSGTDPVRWQGAKKTFDENWRAVERDIAKMDELAPHWTLQANRDRLTEIKQQLPALRATQEAAMNHAAGGDRDAVIKAGDEFADRATPSNEAIKKSLDAMSDSFDILMGKNQEQVHAANRSLNLTMALTTVVALSVGIIVAILMSRRISASTQSILARAKAIAAGDLTREELRTGDNDELGDLARAMNEMQSSLHELIQSMRGTAEQVAAASEELSATSQQITANSEETTAQARVVSEAGGQVNSNLQTVASGAEEMNSTIGEIAKNATEAARVAGEAVAAAESANQTVSKLGDSSVEIGKVIEVITSIAQQTNLLALNATIEAARAGEAGKGFAVVANEVKELAKQTAKATEEIKQKITVIRENAGGAVEAIGGIKGMIDRISHISTEIATAVEEQSATTSEMSRNVTEAAQGAETISSNIQGVAEAAQNTSTNVGEAQTATEHLARMANQLRDQVGRFKVDTASAKHADGGPVTPITKIKTKRKAAGHAAGAR
ncbi:MAG: methyl-accepting chemotaxis protein [Terriglobales bacterium]